MYPDQTKSNFINRVIKHNVKHPIVTTGQLVHYRTIQLALDNLKLAKQGFKFTLDNDII